MPNRVYLLDMGYLIKEGAEGFITWSSPYDHKYGYFDTKHKLSNESENIVKEKARENVRLLSENFANLDNAEPNKWVGCYCVVLNAGFEDDFDEDLPIEEQADDFIYEEYIVDNIVYSVALINGELVEDFIK